MERKRKSSVRLLSAGLMVFCASLMLLAQGCNTEKKPDEAALKKGFEHRPIRLEDVPADQRERVKGFMQMSKNGQAPTAAAGTTAPKKP